MTNVKSCSICHTEYPATSEFFHRNNRALDGFQGVCKSCLKARHNYQPVNNPAQLKRCSKCQQEYPATADYFGMNKQVKSGLTARCRNCLKETSREFVSKHRDEIRAKNLEYSRKNADSNRQRVREWQKANPESRRKQGQLRRLRHPERVHEIRRNWIENNRDWTHDRARLDGALRKARKLTLPNDLTVDDLQRMRDYWENRCAVCGRKASDSLRLVPDHWIALSDPRPDNPGTVPENMVLLCHGRGGCNNSKHNRDPFEWLANRCGEEVARNINANIERYFDWVKQMRNKREAALSGGL